jgi:1-acyl-sn-glycerol-3-phosphate acyltransferase
MKNILNYITYKFNFIKIYFYMNVVPIILLFDFSIKTEIEFLQKTHFYLFSILKNSLYRMTPNAVSHKKNIIYFTNHRTFADFFIDSVVIDNTGTFISRYVMALVIPGGNIVKFITKNIEYFHRKQGKTNINHFECILKRIQDTGRNIIIYPEGTRRHGCDYACDLKKGSIYYSYKNNSPIQFVITYGKDDIINEKKMISMSNVNAFVYYSKVYDQDYEKYKSMEEWCQYINSEWKTFFNTIYTKEHKIEDAFEKIDQNIVYDDNGKRRPINKKKLYIARVAVISISLFCVSKLVNFINTCISTSTSTSLF